MSFSGIRKKVRHQSDSVAPKQDEAAGKGVSKKTHRSRCVTVSGSVSGMCISVDSVT